MTHCVFNYKGEVSSLLDAVTEFIVDKQIDKDECLCDCPRCGQPSRQEPEEACNYCRLEMDGIEG